MGILQHIQAMTGQLAESEAKVAQAILADPHDLERATITRLAQRADTSTSAVLRFCHSLGYAGFKDFRYELISEIQRENDTQDGRDALRDVAAGIARAVQQLADIDRNQIAELASCITRASCVFCVGIHRSALPAEKLRMDLEDLGILAISATDSVHATHLANLADAHSCTVAFSVSGNMASFRATVDAGLLSQGTSWLITSAVKPQLAPHVNHVITLPSAQRAGAGDVDEHPVVMAFVELLVQALRAVA